MAYRIRDNEQVHATTADFVRTCKGEYVGAETVHVDASTPESMRVTINRTGDGGLVAATMVGAWAGATSKDD